MVRERDYSTLLPLTPEQEQLVLDSQKKLMRMLRCDPKVKNLVNSYDDFEDAVVVRVQGFDLRRILARAADASAQRKQRRVDAGGGEQGGQPAERLLPEAAGQHHQAVKDAGLDMTKEEIAAALGRTARHVDNLFVLAKANQTVKKAVASGKIAGAEAVKLLRKDAATAAAKIAEAVKKAEEKGKAKATPKTMQETDAPKRRMTTNQMSISFPTGSKMGDNLKSLAGMIREALDIGEGDILNDQGVMIRFSVTKVDKAAEEEAAKRAEESARRKAEQLAAREAAAAKKAEEKAAKAAAKKKATATAAKKTATDAKAAAKAHLSGGKADEAVKPAQNRKKAAESVGKPKAPAGTKKGGSTRSAPENPAPVDLSDEATGGL